MDDQRNVLEQLNDFLSKQGLKINFLSRQVGISPNTLYCFRSGSRLLSQRQIRALVAFMEEYDKRMDGFLGVCDHGQGNT